jgi:uncharacterized protein YecE (DUF72 family)
MHSAPDRPVWERALAGHRIEVLSGDALGERLGFRGGGFPAEAAFGSAERGGKRTHSAPPRRSEQSTGDAMEIRAGTSGYSYKEWLGSFYPPKLPARDMLSFYAERLPAVEINNTFYRLPQLSVVESWAAKVPSGFRFAVKASQRITHMKRLKDAGDETAYLLRTVGALGERLGALLFQLPPNFKLDRDRFAAFLEVLPAGTRAAFEFRHPSWRDASIAELLRGRDFALVVADTDEEAAEEIVATASWGYLRLRRKDYDREAIAAWGGRIARQPWTEAFVLFKHEDEAAGPRFAAELLAVMAPLAGS